MYVSEKRFVEGIQSEMRKVISVFCLMVLAVTGVFASSPQKHVELLVVDSATGLAGVTSILLNANTSPLYNSNEDISIYVDTTSSTPQLFSFSSDNVPCMSNAYGPLTATTIVRLGVALSAPGTFVFSAQQFTGFDPASMIFLEDRQTHVFTDLRQWQYAVPISQSGEIADRFFLHVTYPPVLSSNAAGCANNDGVIIVTEDSSVVWSTVDVFDSAGALVMVDTGVTGNFNFRGLPGGTYTLRFDYSVYAPIQTIAIEAHQLVTAMTVSNNHDYVYQNIQFSSSTSNASNFYWTFGDGSYVSGASSPVYFYLNPGVFHVTFSCSNDYGCSGGADTTMYIEFPAAVENLDGNSVQIFNDGKNVKIEMDNTNGGKYAYKAYNMEGQEIKAGPVNNADTEIDFTNEASGVYIIILISGTSSISKKVLITH